MAIPASSFEVDTALPDPQSVEVIVAFGGARKRMVDDFVQNPLHADSGMPKTLSLLDLGMYNELKAALDPVVSPLGEELLDDLEYADGLIYGAQVMWELVPGYKTRSFTIASHNGYHISLGSSPLGPSSLFTRSL